MAIDPKLVSIKTAGELPVSDPSENANFLFYEGDTLQRSPMSNIYDKVSSGLLPATTTTVPEASGFHRYLVHEAGTYTNFSGIVVSAADLDVVNGVARNEVILEVNEGVATKRVTRKMGDAASANPAFNPANNTEAPTMKGVADFVGQVVEFTPSPQLFDKATAVIELGSLVAGGGLIATNNHLRGKFPSTILEVGKTYTFKGGTGTPTVGAPKVSFFNAANTSISNIVTTVGYQKEITFTVPASTTNTYIHLGSLANANTYPLRDNVVVNDIMLNEGATALPYEPYSSVLDTSIKSEKIERYDEVLELLDKDLLVDVAGKNKLNPSQLDYTRYYSPGTKTISSNTTAPYVLSGFIAVEEGKWYVISRDNGTTVEKSGGYFAAANIASTAISNISWVTPVNGNGSAFLVPIGSGINFVNLNITATSTAHTATNGNYQFEEGEMASAYEAYQTIEQINPDYLPNESGVTPTDSTALEKYTDLSGIEIHPEISKISNFRTHYSLQDKDVVVANTGTSLTARSDEHCTLRTDAAYRPPLMHSNNYASVIWDALKWRGQQYRRYDAVGTFTESGTGWTTSTNHANWDDGVYRAGYTRYTDDVSATIAFQIPVKAWQFNFIFRSETAGTENAVLTIAEGNGKVQVWNGSAWVEANGYVFSQKQSAQTLPSVTINNAANGFDYTRTNYQIGGNTTYQKRLKMRVIDKAIVKNVTISRTSGRLLYWGVEWSEREFMLTFINAARGSHSISLIDNNLGLSRFQENEIWSFKPDLILTENGIHNSGAAKEPIDTYPTNYWGQITEDFFFSTTNSVSMKARATANGISPEWVIFTSSIAWNFGGINEDGSLKFGTDKNGKVYTALDSFTKAHQYLIENHPEVISINSAKYWVDAGFVVYGDLKTATTGSGKNGLTFTNEGGHWNDTGSKIIARSVMPIINGLKY